MRLPQLGVEVPSGDIDVCVNRHECQRTPVIGNRFSIRIPRLKFEGALRVLIVRGGLDDYARILPITAKEVMLREEQRTKPVLMLIAGHVALPVFRRGWPFHE